jgi:branched-chain amino acid transport system substrate-binding protein
VLYQNTQWGDAGRVEFSKRFTDLGGQIVSAENYLATDTDFRAILSKTRNANPNGLALFSYYTDGALLLQQAQDVGLHVQTVSSGSNFSNEFIKPGGTAVEGSVLTVVFFADDPRPDIRRFVNAYTKAYGEKPDAFAATSYDAVKIAAWATEHGGGDRDGILSCLPKRYGDPQPHPRSLRVRARPTSGQTRRDVDHDQRRQIH